MSSLAAITKLVAWFPFFWLPVFQFLSGFLVVLRFLRQSACWELKQCLSADFAALLQGVPGSDR